MVWHERADILYVEGRAAMFYHVCAYPLPYGAAMLHI